MIASSFSKKEKNSAASLIEPCSFDRFSSPESYSSITLTTEGWLSGNLVFRLPLTFLTPNLLTFCIIKS